MFTRKPGFLKSLTILLLLAAVMLIAVVKFETAPHIPMLFGCTLAGISALISGSTWSEIETGMMKGITSSLASIIVLLLIGILIGVWILAGVVPTLVYYGLSLISPRLFLPSAMVLCGLLSLVVGSWGTIGTIGLALIGLAQALRIPLPVAAGAIVSGAYLGDRISPLSDTANLSSAITGVDIFENVKHKLYLPLGTLVFSGCLYFFINQLLPVTGGTIGQINELKEALLTNFPINIASLFPLILLVLFMLLRMPAIPAIVISILAASLQCLFFRHISFGLVLDSCMYGYASATGIEMLDTLFTTGGLTAMLYSLSMIICAMMFGGIMEHTGQMQVLMAPLTKHIHGYGALTAATVSSCILVNIFIPEEYISISIPGCLFLEEYDQRQIPRKELAYNIGAGGSATSSLIPWNTCGVFIYSILGISPLAYMPFAFYNLLLPLITILAALLKSSRIDKKHLSQFHSFQR